jgi:hypothetical protein
MPTIGTNDSSIKASDGRQLPLRSWSTPNASGPSEPRRYPMHCVNAERATTSSADEPRIATRVSVIGNVPPPRPTKIIHNTAPWAGATSRPT